MNVLAKQAEEKMKEDCRKYPWIVSSDNVNINYKKPEQRKTNKDDFHDGCLITIYPLKDPTLSPLSVAAWAAKRAEGRANSVTFRDIAKLDMAAAPILQTHSVHLILDILIKSQEFDALNYPHRGSPLLKKPPAVRQLPYGLDRRTEQYIMPAVRQEVTSWEGNDRIAQHVFHALSSSDLNTMEGRKQFADESLIFWLGDQLTVARLRGVFEQHCGEFNSYDRYNNVDSHIGWLHESMAFAKSLHANFGGNGNDHGLFHAFKVMERKHLHNPATAGPFFHHLDEGIEHTLESLVSTLWLVVSHKEKLADLHLCSPEELHAFAERIYSRYASNRALERFDAQQMTLESGREDALRRKMMLMTRDLLVYRLGRNAQTYGDVGLLRSLLPQHLYRFVGSGQNGNYAHEILELIQKLEREYTPEMVFVLDIYIITC
jgi:hypothetical protein